MTQTRDPSTGQLFDDGAGHVFAQNAGTVSAYEAADFVADKATSTTSAREAIPTGAISLSVTNEDGTNAARFRFGDVTVVATVTTGFRVLASASGVAERSVPVPSGATHWAYVAEAGTPTINVVWGK